MLHVEEGRQIRTSRTVAVAQAMPLALSAVLTAIVYAGSLGAGFMLDDPMDLPRASGRSFVEIFTSAGESNYFRPIPLAIWKLAYVLIGRHDPVALHVLVLATHTFNGWLVYQLGRRLADTSSALLALAFFIWFPLNYQAVSIVNAYFHVLVTTFVLSAVLLYWDARLDPSPAARRKLALAIVTAGLAMLTHENGLAGIAIVVGAEGVLRVSRRVARWSPAPLGFAAEGVAFLALYWLVPRWQTQWTLDLTSLRQNGLFFLQGLVFPVAGQLANLPRWGLSDARALLLASLVTLAALAVCLVIRGRLANLALGLLWFTTSVAPAGIVLQWDYVSDGPRLLYLASVGVALLWSATLAPTRPGARTEGRGLRTEEIASPLNSQSSRLSTRLGVIPSIRGGMAPGQALGLVIALLILGSSVGFVTSRSALQLRGGEVVAQLAETATRPGPEVGRIYVNLPSWLAFREQGYLLGTTGVTMIPEYIGLGRSVYVHRGEQPEIISLAYPDVAASWDHHYGLHGPPADSDALERAIRQGGGAYLTHFASGRLDLRYVGRVEGEATPGDRYVAQFGDWAVLEEATVSTRGNELTVNLVWCALRKPPGNYTVFVHLVGSTPKPLDQADGNPVGGMFAPQRWLPGDRVYDRRTIPISLEVAAEAKTALIGLYDRASGNRAEASDASQRRYPNDAVPVDLPDGKAG